MSEFVRVLTRAAAARLIPDEHLLQALIDDGRIRPIREAHRPIAPGVYLAEDVHREAAAFAERAARATPRKEVASTYPHGEDREDALVMLHAIREELGLGHYQPGTQAYDIAAAAIFDGNILQPGGSPGTCTAASFRAYREHRRRAALNR